jgi:membrane protein YqaA with SNARE-associated domain
LWRQFAGILLGWGPLGVLFLALLDSAGLPVVGGVDALLITIAARDPQQAYLAAVCAVVGSIAGSLILFAIARKGGEVLLSKHVRSRTGARLHVIFQRYGLITVFVPAISPVPLPMKVPIFCAGALQVRLFYFIAVLVSARAIRYFALAYLGRRYGPQTFHFLASHWIVVACVAGGLAIAASVALRLYQRHETAIGVPE